MALKAQNGPLWCTRAEGTVPVPDAPRRWSDCTNVPPLADANSCRLPPPPPSSEESGHQPDGGRYPECTLRVDWKLPNPSKLSELPEFVDWVEAEL
jgi:hypothetical protein